MLFLCLIHDVIESRPRTCTIDALPHCFKRSTNSLWWHDGRSAYKRSLNYSCNFTRMHKEILGSADGQVGWSNLTRHQWWVRPSRSHLTYYHGEQLRPGWPSRINNSLDLVSGSPYGESSFIIPNSLAGEKFKVLLSITLKIRNTKRNQVTLLIGRLR